MQIKKLRDLSLKTKISIMTLLVAVLPLMLFCIIMAIKYNDATESRSTVQLEENIGVMSDRIERIFADAKLCSNYLTLNINTICSDKNMRKIDRDNQIYSALNQTILIFEGIDSLVYISADGQMYSSNYSLYARQGEIEESEYYQSLQRIKNGKTLLFNRTSECMKRAGGREVVTLGKRIVSINLGETFGFLFVNVDVRLMEEMIQNEISSYFLYDTAGTCVAGNSSQSDVLKFGIVDIGDVSEEPHSEKHDGDKYLISKTKLDTYGWTLLGITNMSAYNVGTRQMIGILIAAGVLTAILLIALSIWLSSRLTKPLTILTKSATDIAEGNLDVELHLSSNDEIGRLGSIFGEMTSRIKTLLSDIDKTAKQKREYELALVQEQVKPHFLYNTLDIIIVLIEMNKPREASRVTKKLADYYKNSLSSSEEIIPLEREMRIIEDYLDLQLMRYNDKFRYNICMDPEAARVSIPKMTLQPLVENAIYHGIKNKEGMGSIDIKVSDLGSKVFISVTDDGIGMDSEELERMIRLKTKAEKHFGIYSVNQRLLLYYQGTEYNMNVTSEKGVGTTISIMIPKDTFETGEVIEA